MGVWKVQLIGGPFDGDRGRISTRELPLRIWAWECGEAFCPVPNRIHWAHERDMVPEDAGAARYELDEQTRTCEVVAYVFPTPAGEPNETFAGVGVDEGIVYG